MELRLLGPVEVLDRGQALAAGPPQQRAVLAVLAVEAGRSVPVEVIVDRVWDTAPPAKARRTLHTQITRIRRLVPVLRQGGGYVLDIDPESVDLHRFRSLVEAALEPQRAREQKVLLLHDALRLWRGQPLAGVPGQWAARMRQTLQDRRIDAVVAWAQAQVELGNPATVIGTLAELVEEHPLVEPLTAVLMHALHAAGRAAQALDSYTTIRRRLVDELGVYPGEQLQQLHQAILRGALNRPAPAMTIPAQLPPRTGHFTGRAAETSTLDSLADKGTVVVVSGPGGIGKTALAVHWAHRVAERFPDGQLYTDLRGFGPAGAATTAEEAVRGFLDAFEVPAARVPGTLQGKVGLYRSLLAGRRVLIVLDNARDADQVRPLLPGAPGCLAIVTSRNRLSGLIAAEGAHPVNLEPLDPGECQDLLAQRVGADQVAAEAPAVDDIIAACARLPLALAIVAARAVAHPGYSLAVLAKELHDTRGSLESFAGDDPATDIRTVFSWSYRSLTPSAARLFRLLSIHPGPEVTAPAAASLAGVPFARAPLAELTHAHLITEPSPGRYSFHDLLRAYATERAEAHDSDADLRAAAHRLLDHYVHTADAAHGLIFPSPRLLTLGPPQPGTRPETPADRAEALAWFAAEDRVLFAVVQRAAELGMDTHAWQLGWTLRNFFGYRGRSYEDATVQHIALAAAERLGDHDAQAKCHRSLADLHRRHGRHDDAHAHLRRALELCEASGDRQGQAHTRLLLGTVLQEQGRFAEALGEAEHALRWYEATDQRFGQGRARSNIGWLHVELGDPDRAIVQCEQALALAVEVGDHYGQACVLETAGYAHHHRGDFGRAVESYSRALDLLRQLEHRRREADVLARLGDSHEAAGDRDASRDAWRRAVHIFDELGLPEADALRRRR